jgi:hypothetical protein
VMNSRSGIVRRPSLLPNSTVARTDQGGKGIAGGRCRAVVPADGPLLRINGVPRVQRRRRGSEPFQDERGPQEVRMGLRRTIRKTVALFRIPLSSPSRSAYKDTGIANSSASGTRGPSLRVEAASGSPSKTSKFVQRGQEKFPQADTRRLLRAAASTARRLYVAGAAARWPLILADLLPAGRGCPEQGHRRRTYRRAEPHWRPPLHKGLLYRSMSPRGKDFHGGHDPPLQLPARSRQIGGAPRH